MSKSLIVDALEASVTEVISTFTGQKPEIGKSFIRKEIESLGEVSAILGLTGKGFTGTFVVTFEKECLFDIVAALFGTRPETINDETRDAAGEMANMICGAFRRRFEKQGISLQSSTPAIVSGENHTLDILCKSQRLVIPFSVNGSKLFVEFCLDKK
ncbi:chemotaxis protein CheX [Thermodesulfatator atlanticus]|uniref:chemotaxis protein CheX n=1 Tax=Thermodesulfatator atlanticus TaxID=501497 RepID=UPI0003B6CB17|nr:chemotaxis protein CheX [Thermodesulfatator atlanticus]